MKVAVAIAGLLADKEKIATKLPNAPITYGGLYLVFDFVCDLVSISVGDALKVDVGEGDGSVAELWNENVSEAVDVFVLDGICVRLRGAVSVKLSDSESVIVFCFVKVLVVDIVSELSSVSVTVAEPVTEPVQE